MGLTDQIVLINRGVCERYCQTRAVFDGEGPQMLRQRFTRCRPRLQPDGSHLSRIPRQSFQKCLTNLPKSALPAWELLKVFRQSSQRHHTKVPKGTSSEFLQGPLQSLQKCLTKVPKSASPEVPKVSCQRFHESPNFVKIWGVARKNSSTLQQEELLANVVITRQKKCRHADIIRWFSRMTVFCKDFWICAPRILEMVTLANFFLIKYAVRECLLVYSFLIMGTSLIPSCLLPQAC